MNKVMMVISAALALSACASNPYKAEKLETVMEKREKVSGDLYIGIKNDLMVTQKKVLISEELRSLQNATYELESNVYGGPRYFDRNGKWGALRNCQIRQASVANGGEGKLSFIEARDYVVPDEDFTSIGVDEAGNLVVVTEEYIKDRIVRFRNYKQVLEKRQDEMQSKIHMCELAVQAQQSSHVAQGQ